MRGGCSGTHTDTHDTRRTLPSPTTSSRKRRRRRLPRGRNEGGTAHTQHTTRSEEERRLHFLFPPPCLLLFLTCSTSHLPSSEPFLFLSVCCLSVRFTFLKSAGVLCTSGFCLKSASCVKTGLSFLTLPPRHPRFFFCFYCPLVSQGGAPTNSGVLKSSFLSGG